MEQFGHRVILGTQRVRSYLPAKTAQLTAYAALAHICRFLKTLRRFTKAQLFGTNNFEILILHRMPRDVP